MKSKFKMGDKVRDDSGLGIVVGVHVLTTGVPVYSVTWGTGCRGCHLDNDLKTGDTGLDRAIKRL